MTPQIVPLAAMTPAALPVGRALAVSDDGDGDAELIVLHEEETSALTTAAGDALVTLLCAREADAEGMTCAVDFRRARALLSYEIERARGGVVHLTSVYLYLAQVAGNAAAQRVVSALESRLGALGVTARAPESVQREVARARRTRAPRVARRSRRPVGTRSVGLMFALFGL